MTSWPKPSEIHTVIFDFDGVFTNNKVYLDADGNELVRCDRGDGLGIGILRRAKKAGKLSAEFFILSTEKNLVVSARARKLGLECHQGIGDKLKFAQEYVAKRHSGDFRGLIYLGNDLNDLPIMELAGFSVAPNDAHARVRAQASAVLPQNGGDGFVRAFVEKFLGLDALSTGGIHELVSDC